MTGEKSEYGAAPGSIPATRTFPLAANFRTDRPDPGIFVISYAKTPMDLCRQTIQYKIPFYVMASGDEIRTVASPQL